MPNKTNQERIIDNNDKIDEIKSKVSDLPDYQDLTQQTAIQSDVRVGKTFYNNSGILNAGTAPDTSIITETVTNTAELETITTTDFINNNLKVYKDTVFAFNKNKDKIYAKYNDVLSFVEIDTNPSSYEIGCVNVFKPNCIIIRVAYTNKLSLIEYDYSNRKFTKLNEINYLDVVDEDSFTLNSIALNPTRNLIAISSTGSHYYIYEIQNDYSLRKLFKDLMMLDHTSYALKWINPYNLNVGSTGLISDVLVTIYSDLTYTTYKRGYGSSSTLDPKPLAYNLEGTYCARGKGKPSGSFRSYFCTGQITIHKCTTNSKGVTTITKEILNTNIGEDTSGYSSYYIVWFNETTFGVYKYYYDRYTDLSIYIIDKSTDTVTKVKNYSYNYDKIQIYALNVGLGYLIYNPTQLIYYQVKLDGETHTIGAYINDNYFGTSMDATATATDLLAGKTAYSKNEIITGTMPNNGQLNYTPSTSQQTIPAGYTSGGTISAVTSAIDNNIQANNIKKDIEILGVTGTLEGGVDTSDANAIEDDLALDKTAYVNGQKITGTLETTDAISIDNSTNTDTYLALMNIGNIPSMVVGADINDLYGVRKIVEDGTGLEIIAPQSQIANVISLTADKIKKGETILEITGTYEGSGGGSGDVKLFETEQAMQADPDASEGDLAVVYREETQPATESSAFDKCIFPNTVVLNEAFDDYNSGEYNAVDPVSGDFNASCELSSSSFTFNGSGDAIGTINIEYESSDGITYTRADGGAELQEFGTTITRDVWSDQWVDAIGEFIQLRGNNYFEGLYKAVNSGNTITYQLASTQLDAISSYVYGKTFYGQNGIDNGVLTTNVDNSFADINAEVVYKIQQQYENMTPRVLTDSDKTIDRNIYFIPTKKDGTPLLDTSSVTGMTSLFERCVNLVTIPLLDTSAARYMGDMFGSCSNLTSIPLLDTSNVITITHMFEKCTNLVSIPSLNTSKVSYMDKVFLDCTSLVTIPVLDTSSATNMDGMFSGCSSLSNDSLNNILQMCINATNMTSNKTLKYIGLTSTQATTCQSLSNYSAFTAAGWTTGY